MTKLIAVFKSKTQLFIFIRLLKSNGAFVETVATPKDAKIGCGLSAKFDHGYFNLAVKLINQNGLDTFYQMYKVTKKDGRTSTYRVL